MELDRPLSTVTPTLDGDVLVVLANYDGTFTTGQLHRIIGRHSLEGIRKVLQRLTGQGVVLADRVGQTFVYRLNRDHLAAEHIIALAGLKKSFLRHLGEHLAGWPVRPVYAAVFGSAARRSMTVESDVDLLLIRPDEVDDQRWDAQLDELADAVTRWVGNEARPLVFTAAEVTARGRDEPVLRDVLYEGITVAGDRAWLAERLRNEKG